LIDFAEEPDAPYRQCPFFSRSMVSPIG
jgi:hypothetical protein